MADLDDPLGGHDVFGPPDAVNLAKAMKFTLNSDVPSPMVLPPGMTPLSPEQFSTRFPQLLTDLFGHLARRVRIIEAAQGHPILTDDKAEAVGKELAHRIAAMALAGKIQFAVARNGDPAVFSSHARSLTEEEQQIADALVSYFDSTGTFNEQTGEIVDRPTLIAQLGVEIAALITGLTMADYSALAIVGDTVKATPTEIVGLLKRAMEERTDVTPETFTKGVLSGFYKHAQEKGEGVEVILRAANEVRACYTAYRLEEVLKVHAVLEPEATARRVDSAAQVALAFLVYELARIAPTDDRLQALRADPNQLMEQYAAWRLEHPDAEAGEFHDHLVPLELRQPLANAYHEFKGELEEHLRRKELEKAEKAFPSVSLDEWITEEVPHLIAESAMELNASKRIIREILDRWVGAGVISFARTPKGIAGVVPDDWPVMVNKTERGLCEIFKRRFHTLAVSREGGEFKVEEHPAEARPKTREPRDLTPPPASYRGPGDHTYMRAVAAQYSTLVKLQELVNATSKRLHAGVYEAGGLDLQTLLDNWMIDIRSLRQAETYCWWDETTRAAEHAAAVFPESIALTEDLSDCVSGFWYFLSPRHVQTVSDPDLPIVAMLWAWTADPQGKHKALRITALTDGTQAGVNGLNVSTLGMWPDGMTLAQALRHNQHAYRRMYPGGAVDLIGEEKTLAAIEYMFRFYLMGWLWMREKIPVLTRRGIRPEERNHKRHRKLEELARRVGRPLTDVQVIQLRRREMVRRDDPNVPEAERRRAIEYQCRWIVKGHTRNQWYPSEGRHRPKWIKSYDKGPEDKPLKTPTLRVHVVNR